MKSMLVAAIMLASASVALAAPASVGKLGTPIKMSKASIKLECGSKSYTLSTGTGGGSCSVHKTDDGNVGVCNDGNGGQAGASCKDGCIETHNKGSCS